MLKEPLMLKDLWLLLKARNIFSIFTAVNCGSKGVDGVGVC